MATDLEPFINHEYDMRVSPVTDEKQLSMALEWNYEEMTQLREPWEWLWREIWDYCLPEREALLNYFQQTSYGTDGAKGWVKRIGQKIYDHTAPNALLLLTAGLQGYMVSQQDRWFRLSFPDERMIEVPGARQYLKEVENAIYLALARSNFYSQLTPLILDAATGGTASMRMFYDMAHQRHVFHCIHPIEVFIAQNHLQQVDTVYRTFKLNRRQAIQHFGAANLSQELLDTESDTEQFLFLHAVFPRGDTDAQMGLRERSMASILSADAPYISVYKELATGNMNAGNRLKRGGGGGNRGGRADMGKIASVGGFQEFPYAVWRWDLDTQSTYGSSPSRRLLSGIRQLNEFGLNLSRAARMAADPPWNIPASQQDRVRITPRGFNYYTDANHMVQPIHSAAEYPVGVDREQRLSEALEQAYGTPYFMAMSQLSARSGDKTATQFIGVESEKAAVLSSAMGRMGSDLLEVTIDWTFQQEWRFNRLPPPPPWMQRMDGTWERLVLDYISPLAQAQRRLAIVQRRMRFLEMTAPIAAIRPDVYDNVNFDKMFRNMAFESGLSEDDLRAVKEVQQLREEAQQREDQRQAIENAEGISRAKRNMEGTQGGAGADAGGTALPPPAQR